MYDDDDDDDDHDDGDDDDDDDVNDESSCCEVLRVLSPRINFGNRNERTILAQSVFKQGHEEPT